MHSWVLPSPNGSQIFDISESLDQVSAVSFYLEPSGNLCVQSWADVMGSYGNKICHSLSGRSDVLVRYTRDTTNKRVSLELWNTAGGGYVINGGPNGAVIDSVVLKSWAGRAVFGGRDLYFARPWSTTGGAVQIAWAKWHSSIIGTGAAPPRSSDTADWADWRFEGNGSNTTSYNFGLSVSSSNYQTTPEYDPVSLPRTYGAPGWTNWLSLRAGYPGMLDATASFTDETGSLSYMWEQTGGPTRIDFQDPTSPQPILLGHMFGTYRVRLTVTSPSGRTHQAELDFGSVATDNKDVVIYPDERLSVLLGPTVIFGKNDWMYMDERHKKLSEYYGGLLTTRYVPTWRTLLSGTVNMTANSTTVTGVDTTFNSELDCNSSRDLGDFIAVRYADARVPGGFRYRASKVKTCTATAITLEFPWDGPTLSGASFGKFRMQDYGYWNGGGDGANYYDNVLAHYSMYFRSGNTVHRDFARELADRFIEAPLNDYFGSNGSGGYYYALAPRVRSLTGLMMRALDGRPDIWRFLWDNVWNAPFGDIHQNNIVINPANFLGNRDPREEAYRIAHMSQAAQLYPLDLPDASTIRSTLVNSVNDALTKRWQPTLRPDGSQRNYFSDRLLGQAVVTNGSVTVTANGNSTFPGNVCSTTNKIWFVRSWLDADQDVLTYPCTRNSATQITLGEPYKGTSGTKSYTYELINGPPTQPFMQGIVATAMWQAWNATGSVFAREHVLKTMDWLVKFGWRPASKGLYYIRSAASCEPDPEAVRFCVDQGDFYDPGTREYAAEVVAGFSWANLLNGSNRELQERADKHTGVLFGAAGFGGPSTEDGFFGPALIVPNGRQGKYFGFYFGFGVIPTWPAARKGGLDEPKLVTTQVPYELVAGAESARLTVLRPNGEQTQHACSGSPCSATVDARQGTHLGLIEFLNSEGQVMSDSTTSTFYIGIPAVE